MQATIDEKRARSVEVEEHCGCAQRKVHDVVERFR
jgi:hypothetical protein